MSTPEPTRDKGSRGARRAEADPPGEVPKDLRDAGWTLKEHVNDAGEYRLVNKKLRLDTSPCATPQLAFEAARRIERQDKTPGRKRAEAERPPEGKFSVSRRVTQPLKVALDDAARLAKLDELTEKLTKKEEIEQELKEVAAGYKGQVSTLKGDIHALNKVLTDRAEEREVECEERMYYDSRLVCVVRLDTGEVVDQRKMTADEQQRPLLQL